VALIASWSRGVPRLINVICDNALLGALAVSSHVVKAGGVFEVISDLDLQRPEDEPRPAEAPAKIPQPTPPRPSFLHRWAAKLITRLMIQETPQT
jgi:hypothetical protein